ncbi:MAG: hypothetical protein KC731_02165 [Myxococcales bacterium]|nr:hypothetical protein [Myxococcales bacterium]
MAQKKPRRRYSPNWGGRRPGAGRPKSPHSGAPHKARPDIEGNAVVHVWWTTLPEFPSLRSAKVRRLLHDLIADSADREGCRVVYFGVKRDRLDVVCETDDSIALTRSMQGLGVRVARQLNGALGRSGKVFAERYREEVLDGREQLETALAALGGGPQTVLPPRIRRLKNAYERTVG